MMRWLRKLFAWLRRSRSQPTPVPAPEPEPTKAEPPIWRYSVTVELPTRSVETNPYVSRGRPVTVGEVIDLGAGRHATVLEVIEEADSGVRDGKLRARLVRQSY